MNEADAMEVLNGVVANALSAQTIFFTALSAYMAVAYTVGKKLTRYQVTFVNTVFIVIFLNMSGNQLGLLQAATYYVQIVEQARAAVVDPIGGVPAKLNMQESI